MLLLKTPGGSSFIWFVLRALREDILRFTYNFFYLLCVATVAYFFRPEHCLFVLCLGQTNAFTVILNVIEHIDIYQHSRYGTISVFKD